MIPHTNEIHFDDALDWLIERLVEIAVARPRQQAYYQPRQECDLWLPDSIQTYWQKRGITAQDIRGSEAEALYSPFYDAAWELCRRGILRPGKITPRGEFMCDALGDHYSLTAFGQDWLKNQQEQFFLPNDPGRLTEIFQKFVPRFELGFQQRASEAVACHRLSTYLACCVMAGAAAESILLAVAISKSGDEEATLKEYSGSSGRKKITDKIIQGVPGGLGDQFKTLCSLLNYWRDQAGHGTVSNISEIEAFNAISRLLQFAQFADDNWPTLTS